MVNASPHEIDVLFLKLHKFVFLFAGDHVKSKKPPQTAVRFPSILFRPRFWSAPRVAVLPA
jgi:hypothetical protein